MARMRAFPRATLAVQLQRRQQRQRERQRLTEAFSRDPRTGVVRRGAVQFDGAVLTLRLPKRLESPNKWLWVHHQVKGRAKKAWATLIAVTTCDAIARPTRAVIGQTPAAAFGWAAPKQRVRVTVRRLVARRSHFITDDDNLAFAGKGLMDCVVQAGFLRDDHRDAIALQVEQGVSPDGQPWTEIEIAPLPVVEACR